MIGRGNRPDDIERLEAAYVANAPDLLIYLGRRVHIAADAADLLSETFLVATRRRRDLPLDAHEVRLWLFGVARRVLANAHRGTERAGGMTEKLRAHLATVPPEIPRDEAFEIREALNTLPPGQAELVRLVLWERFTVPEAAVILGTTESTARGRYQRARANLRLRLRHYENEWSNR